MFEYLGLPLLLNSTRIYLHKSRTPTGFKIHGPHNDIIFCMVLIGSIIYNHKQSQNFVKNRRDLELQVHSLIFRFTLTREAHIHRAQNIRNNNFVIIISLLKSLQSYIEASTKPNYFRHRAQVCLRSTKRDST